MGGRRTSMGFFRSFPHCPPPSTPQDHPGLVKQGAVFGANGVRHAANAAASLLGQAVRDVDLPWPLSHHLGLGGSKDPASWQMSSINS
jgi:hypothetical protein